MTKLILFVGTPGAGKSTILQTLASQQKPLMIVNLGDQLLKIAQERQGKESQAKADPGMVNRDIHGTLSAEQIREDRELALNRIIAAKQDTIIDTHLTIKYGRRYVPGMTIAELEKIRIKAIIYIDASAKEIWDRRHSDPTKAGRRNVNDTEAEIDEQRSINLAILSSCAIYLSIPIYIIYNSAGKQADAAAELDKIVHEHFGV